MGATAFDTLLEAGRDAVARRAWPEAFDALSSADAGGPLEPDDLVLLAKAAWWIGRASDAIDTFERAYSVYVRSGIDRRAASVALTLRRLHAQRLERSVATGWLTRAERLLDDAPEGAAHAYLAIAHAELAWDRGEFEHALDHTDHALSIAEGAGDRDLLAWAVMRKGMVLVSAGRLDEGWALMEEVSVAAVGGELGAYTTGAVFCNVVEMCRDMADFARAREWSDAAKRWCERQAINGFPGVCRIHRAEVMRLMGSWVDAEQEVRLATEELRDFNPAYAGMAFHELGEVRLRMGDLEAAQEAFDQAHAFGTDPQPGLALLRLAEGKVDSASASITRSLQELTWDRLARARLLPAHAEIARAGGDVGTARAAGDELEEIAEEFGTTAIRAAAEWAHGLADLASGDAVAAASRLRAARQRWSEIDAPYEAARARVALAESFVAEGDREAAGMELRSARTAFERLGATRDATRTNELLRAISVGAPPERARRTFVFTDIVGSTSLLEAIGDEAWSDLSRWHDESLRAAANRNGGEEADHAGDGFFFAFSSVESALAFAQEVQRSLAEHRREHGFAPQVRIGLHAAEATSVDGGYQGKGVHAAARIGAVAEGGEIIASASSVEGIDGVEFRNRRSVSLKGIAEPVEIVSIDWR